MPSIVGFGAVLDNLSGLLDNQPLATTIVGATAAWLLIWSFLSGGIIDRLARDRSTRTSGFFAACGVHVWRLLRLGLIAAVVYYVLFGLVHPWIFDDVYPALTDEVTVERTAFIIRLGGYALFAAPARILQRLFDYARIRIGHRRAPQRAGGVCCRGKVRPASLPSVSGVYLLNAALYLALIALYGLLAPSVPGQGIALWGALLFGQAYIVVRHYLKLLFYASNMRAVPVGARARRLHGGAEAGLAGIPGG